MRTSIIPGTRFVKAGPSRIVLGSGAKRKSIVPDFRNERAREEFKNYVARPKLFAAQHERREI